MTSTRPRLADVAVAAGVSLATASRAVNGSDRNVTEELRARVLAAAVKLGYSVDARAQSVATGRSNVVALVVGDVADPYFSSIAAGVVRQADESRLAVSIAAAGAERHRAAETALLLRGERPRAVVVAVGPGPSGELLPDLAELVEQGTAVAALTPGLDLAVPDGVLPLPVDNRAAAAALATALVALGYCRFLVLSNEVVATARERTAGFFQGAAGHNVQIDVRLGALTRDGGYDLMAAAIAEAGAPDCVFAATDVMAVGAMTAIRDAGLRPGDGIGVAGFDDIALLQDIQPSLTTVALPLHEMGAAALRLALGLPTGVGRSITGVVRLRASTPGVVR